MATIRAFKLNAISLTRDVPGRPVVGAEFIYIFEADIPAIVLETFAMPGNNKERTDWLVIRRKEIPFQPYTTFRKRLINVLTGKASTPVSVGEPSSVKRKHGSSCEPAPGQAGIERRTVSV
ncbi:hypothetical protein C2857_004580 [Epichloe festucae Fl1]|uniref:Uncharacterized protein n=1 Tax=Epichloe festucae (strain Fl1) TaxID=877507 RepID=A0A7U3SMW7_EPIFF|nr:hypothetical protein C2857_004580 [Epichloe festucae Fl1]